MNINPMTALPLTASALPSTLARTQSPLSDTFQKLTHSSEYAKRHAEAEEAAAGLVSSALIMPILQQFRRSSLNTKSPFSPGTGEKAFGPQFDMQMADQIAHSPRLGIKEALTRQLMKKAAPAVASRLDKHG